MSRMHAWVCCFVALMPGWAAAQPAVGAATPIEAVQRFHEALKSSDPETAILQLAPDLVVFETGFAEAHPRAYADNNLALDLAFAVVTDRRIVEQVERVEDKIAWVLTRSELTSKPGTDPIALRQTETMILRQYADGWKIAHIHWSAHPFERD